MQPLPPKVIAHWFGTNAIDAASYVGTSWFTPSYSHQYASQQIRHYDINWVVATAASLTLYISNTNTATVTVALALKAGSTTIDTIHGSDFFVKGSMYFNFKTGATTTLKYLNVIERIDW